MRFVLRQRALPAQLDLVQVQQHENILCFGALVAISLMKNTLDLILHNLVIYYRAMEVKETCNSHLFNNQTVQLLFFQCWVLLNTQGPQLKNKKMS